MLHSTLAPALGLALCAAAGSGATAQHAAPEAGASAPRDTWYARGGCAARTGVTATEAPRTAPELAWSATAGGTIVGEPLVWGDRAVLEVERSDGSRRLEVLELARGARIATSSPYARGLALQPCLWGEVIAARTAEGRLELLVPGARGLSPTWRLEGAEPVEAPLLFGAELYLRHGGEIERWLIGADEPDWRAGPAPGAAFEGELALRGERVFALERDGQGRVLLVTLDRSTGAPLCRTPAGQTAGVPESGAAAIGFELAVLDPEVYVRHARPIALAGGGFAHGVMVQPAGAGTAGACAGLIGIASDPVDLGASWLALFDQAPHGLSWLRDGSDADAHASQLAGPELHPEFTRDRVPASVAGGTVLVGARAFDPESSRIAWSLDRRARARAVPIRAGLLLVEGANALVALRAPPPATAGFAVDGRDLRREGRSASAVLQGGGAFAGILAPARDGVGLQFVTAEAGLGEVPVERLLWVEDADGRALVAAGGGSGARGAVRLLEQDHARRLLSLAERAIAARDSELAADLLGRAAALRGLDATITAAARRLRDLRRRAAPRDERKAAETSRLAEEAEAELARELVERAELLPARAPRSLAVELVREAVEIDPDSPAAADWLRAFLPAELAPPEAAGARPELGEWVDLASLQAHSPLRLVDGSGGAGRDGAAEALLREARASWRPDLTGLRSRRLLVLTPVQRAGLLARMLSLGELVATALEEISAGAGTPLQPAHALTLHLFEDRAEYLASGRGRKGDEATLVGLSSGHYDPEAKLSRLFLPEAGAGEFDRLAGVYAHELAHHWLDAALPATSPTGLRGDGSALSGFWIVEGLAGFVQELEYDLDGRTWSRTELGAESVDALANLPSRARIPWPELFAMTQDEFARLSSRDEHEVEAGRYLGRRRGLSRLHVFYAQAAAACHYLYAAEGGKNRAALLAYARGWYGRDASALDVSSAFGRSAAELGAAIERFARAGGARRDP